MPLFVFVRSPCRSIRVWVTSNKGNYTLDESSSLLEDGDGDEGFFLDFVDYCGNGTVVLLRAFFDESERKGQLCVAGVAFAGPQAAKVTKELRAVFGPYGGLHTTDLLAKRAGYKGISDQERNRLIKEAVRIVGARYSYAVVVHVGIEEYMRQAPTFIRGLGGAYSFLCHNAMVGMKRMLDKHSDSEPVSYVFEAGHAHENEAREFVRQVVSVPELKRFFRHHSDAFIPKADAVPLQAADLFAYEAMKFKLETVDEPKRQIRLSFLSLYAARPDHVRIYYLQGQRLTKSLNKYRELGFEQMKEEMECQRQKQILMSSRVSSEG